MRLIAAWEFDEYLYQLWEMGDEYLCQCVHMTTLETLWEARSDTPGAAIVRGIRQSLRGLS